MSASSQKSFRLLKLSCAIMVASMPLSACNFFSDMHLPKIFEEEKPVNYKDLEPPDVREAREQAESELPKDMLETAGRFELKKGGNLGALGLNLETYFTEEINPSQERRIEKLENTVSAMQKDLEIALPAVQEIHASLKETPQPQTMAAMQAPAIPPLMPPKEPEKELASFTPQNLLPEKQPPAPQPSPAEQTPEQPAPETVTPPPAPQATTPETPPKTTNTVKIIRAGQSDNAVRLVLELEKTPSYEVKMNETRDALMVMLKDTGWSAPKDPATDTKLANLPVLKSYTTTTDTSGTTTLTMALDKPSTIQKHMALDPVANGNYRLFIDLTK